MRRLVPASGPLEDLEDFVENLLENLLENRQAEPGQTELENCEKKN